MLRVFGVNNSALPIIKVPKAFVNTAKNSIVLLKKNRIAAIVGLIFAVELTALFFYYNQENNLLKSQLKNFIVSPVSLDGKIYDVENGDVKYEGNSVPEKTESQILRIAYSSVLSRLDPIFGMEGTDPDKLSGSVKDLEASLGHIASLYDKNDEKTIGDNLYPVEFLKSVAETEKARQESIYAPSFQNTERYYKKIEGIIDMGISYLGHLEKIYRNDKKLSHVTFHFFGGYSTDQSYASAAVNAQNELENKKLELNNRLSCLNYFSTDCPSLKKALSNSGAAPELDGSATGDIIPENIAANAEIFNLYVGNGQSKNSSAPKFPVTVLGKSKCFPDENQAYYQPWLRTDQYGNEFFAIGFIGDLYFYNTKYNSNLLIGGMAKEGLPYLYQPAANLYMCQEAGSDLSRAITIDTVRSSLISNPVANGIDIKTAGAALAQLENKITGNNAVYEYDTASYVETLRSLLSSLGETRLSGIIGRQKVLYMEKIISIYRQKSPRFDEIIRDIIFTNAIVETFIKEKARVDIPTLFLSRSYPSLLLLTYNKSAFDAPLQMTTPEPLNLSAFDLISYNEKLKYRYNQNEILEMMRAGRKLQHE